nr:reverse transcriptase domain-containing protein [Tanacetum cinerariifolium]
MKVVAHTVTPHGRVQKKGDGSGTKCNSDKRSEGAKKGRNTKRNKIPDMEIDWKVDSPFDFKLKCFQDAYKGYHQIQMAKEDEHKMAFYAMKGVHCCKKISFGLKNAGATYQRLGDKVFESQLRRNMKAYVDDMVIKSMDEFDMLADIQETFKRLRKINMKINPKRCSFGMKEGQFL